MNRYLYHFIFILIILLFSCERFESWEGDTPASQNEDINNIMSTTYWAIWNETVQANIDENINKYRKADASLNLQNLSIGTIITIEQKTHSFVFGAQIFNFNQLGSIDLNNKYKDLFGTIFNSATVPFYWKGIEPKKDYLRFEENSQDSEEFWNNCTNPTAQIFWRRPPTDPIVEFCENKNIRIHGHPLTWGNRLGQMPFWIWNTIIPEEKYKMDNLVEEYANSDNRYQADIYSDEYYQLTPKQLEAIFPAFTVSLNYLYFNRIKEIAKHYYGRIDSWDVVNESTTDFSNGVLIPYNKLCKSIYGIMPGDYAYKSFIIASDAFPNDIQLGINDFILDENYLTHIRVLRSRECKIDMIGAQMHILDPAISTKIVNGEEIQTPSEIINWAENLGEAGLPIHISEVTIPAPDDNPMNQMAQAVIARNLYRLWFSIEPIMGITWWNLVDNCGSISEPKTSGLFHRDMSPKPAYIALENLINSEWKTKSLITLDSSKIVKFRGFKGLYTVSWYDDDNNLSSLDFYLQNDGDGI